MLRGAEAHPDPQCLPHGDQPSLPVAGYDLREYAGCRHLQLPGYGTKLQRWLQRLYGVAYFPELDGSRDMCTMQADRTEGAYLAKLDLEQLCHYREREVHGNMFRHQQKYGLLLDARIEPPFIRNGYHTAKRVQ